MTDLNVRVVASASLAQFQLALLKFTLRAEDAVALPAFAGSTLRGAFGAMFRRIACAPHCADAQTCLLASACAYARVFEAHPDVAGFQPMNDGGLPRPYIFHPAIDRRDAIEPGGEFAFHLALVGMAADFAPYFILAWRELGRVGLGARRGRFRLERVESCASLDPDAPASLVYSSEDELVRNSIEMLTADRLLAANPRLPSDDDAPANLRIELLMPLRLKSGGEFLRDHLPFDVFAGALLRRLESLSFLYCGGSLQLDYRALIARARQAQLVCSDLRWVAWERFSQRQEQRIPWGGIVGNVEYAGEFAAFREFLALGELVGVGNNCAFGLGRYDASLIEREGK
jgi:hypothetical protein